MKVAFIARSTLKSVSGGDTTQILQTAKHLERIEEIKVDIYSSLDDIPYDQYELLHFFNVIRPADHLKHIGQSSIPYVISPIYVDYHDFDTRGRMGASRYIFKVLGKNWSEYAKNLARFIKRQDKPTSLKYLLGHKKAVKKLLKGADCVLPNSLSEWNRLVADYRVSVPFHVIPNGIDEQLFVEEAPLEEREKRILCVGQLYGRKNQHRLILVCKELGLPLVLVGKSPPNHKPYLDFCKTLAEGADVSFHDFMPQEELKSFYRKSYVHVLPSWFETTGLSSLEAGAMGCKLVVGRGGDTTEYFDGIAEFCEAGNIASIKDAIIRALKKPIDYREREHILKNYTWEKAAEETFLAYKKVLDRA